MAEHKNSFLIENKEDIQDEPKNKEEKEFKIYSPIEASRKFVKPPL